MKDSYITKSGEETSKLAKELFKEFGPGKVWLLYGNLGAGKTTFVKGIAKAMQIDEGKVKSPTFTFTNEIRDLIHYDLYRLEKPDESISELLHEHLKTGKTIVIEWPEIMENELKIPHIKVQLKHLGGDNRELRVIPHLS